MSGPLGRAWADGAWGGFTRRHAPTLVLAAALGVLAALGLASGTLETLPDRMVGMATMHAIEVDARVGVYVRAFLFACGAALATAGILRVLERLLDPADLRALGMLSWATLSGLFLTLWNSAGRPLLATLLALQALVLVASLADRHIFRRRAPADRGAWTAWTVVLALALSTALYDLGIPERIGQVFGASRAIPAMALAALAVHLVLQAGGVGPGGARRADTLAAFSLPVALFPLATMAARELAIALHAPDSGPTPRAAFAGVACVLALLGVALAVRAWKRGLDLERALSCWAIPLFVMGWAARGFYESGRFLPWELFESGNSGLSIQQWFEFGRLPFIETFDGHCLSDAVPGFVYAAIFGTEHAGSTQYDVILPGIEAAARFLVLRAVLGRSGPALLIAFLWPMPYLIVPAGNALPLAGALIVVWALRRADRRGWIGLCAWCVAMFLWRLDIGLTTTIAAAAVVALCMLREPRLRASWRSLATTAAGFALACVALWTVLCLAHGVGPIQRARDVLLLLGTNQAFGYDRIAPGWDAIARWHYFGLPAVTLFVLGYVLLRQARGERWSSAAGALAAIVAYAAIYQMAFFPRSLGRHSLFEAAGTMSITFAFVLPGMALYLAWRERRRPAALLALGLSPVLLMLLLDPIQGPKFGRADAEFTGSRLARRFDTPPILASGRDALAHDLVRHERPLLHATELVPFLRTQLTSAETFFDLTNCPMLYWLAHKPSPHWLNHVMLAAGDRLQARVIEDLAAWDVPIVLKSGETEPANTEPTFDLDGVRWNLRQQPLHEWVHDRYQPILVVQRWSVWGRKDWALREPPLQAELRTVWRSAEPRADGGGATRVSVRRPGGRAREGTADLRTGGAQLTLLAIEGEAHADCALGLRWRTEDGQEYARSVRLEAGAQRRWYPLAGTLEPRALESLEIEVPAELALRALRVEECAPVGCHEALGAAFRPWAYELEHLPALLGRSLPRELETLRRLGAPGEAHLPSDGSGATPRRSDGRELAVRDVTGELWRSGIHLSEAVVRLEGPSPLGVRPGDELVFAASGARRVLRCVNEHVRVEGAPLDPDLDGAPAVVLHLPAKTPEADRIAGPRPFEPLDEPRGHVLLAMDLTNANAEAVRVQVDLGWNDQPDVRFVFLAPSGASRCLVPVSADYNWVGRRMDRAWIVPQSEGVRIESARIVRDPLLQGTAVHGSEAR